MGQRETNIRSHIHSYGAIQSLFLTSRTVGGSWSSWRKTRADNEQKDPGGPEGSNKEPSCRMRRQCANRHTSVLPLLFNQIRGKQWKGNVLTEALLG